MPKKTFSTPPKDKSTSLADTPLDIDLSEISSTDKPGCFDPYQSGNCGQTSYDRLPELFIQDEKPTPLCPHCGSGLIKRIHRGFIRKTFFKSLPLFKCGECKKTFDSQQISMGHVSGNPRQRSNNQ